MSVLSEFIQVEKKRYEDEDGYRFDRSLGQASSYYGFIQVINDRHKKSNKELNEALKDVQDFAYREGISITKAKRKILKQKFKRAERAELLVHLEIESCYLFSKIFLDKIALFLPDYFGPERGISLASHDKLVKNHEEYRIAKGLIYPDGFPTVLRLIKENICDYRDKQISHLQSLHSQKLAFFDRDGQTRLMTLTPPTPNKSGTRIDSKKAKEILSMVDSYIQHIIELIKLNRAKSRFKSKE